MQCTLSYFVGVYRGNRSNIPVFHVMCPVMFMKISMSKFGVPSTNSLLLFQL